MSDPISTIEAQTATLRASKEQLREQLREIGVPYEEVRAKAQSLREQAEPLVAALASADVAQGEIARDLRVTRETIRRIEIKYGIDRGDPRAQRGPREVQPEDALRARILELSADGVSVDDISGALNVTRETVRRVETEGQTEEEL